MEEKSNFQELQEFASRTKRKFFYKEEKYEKSGVRYPKYRRTAYIINNTDMPSYYVLYSDPYYKLAIDTVFCGVYFPVNIPLDSRITFTKKDIIDRLNPFLMKKVIDTRNRKFDSKVVTKGNDPVIVKKLTGNIQFQTIIIESFKIDELFYYSVNDMNVDFVEDLKGKSHFSICNPRKWILDFALIEKWFDIIDKLQRTIIEQMVNNTI